MTSGIALPFLHTRLDGLEARLAADPVSGRDDPDPCSKANLLWLCQTALAHINQWPMDKAGRWAGFVEGVLAEGENDPVSLWPMPPPALPDPGLTPRAHAHQKLLDRYQTLPSHTLDEGLKDFSGMVLRHLPVLSPAAMGLCLGYLQGRLCRRGWCEVGVEREFSRPLFHAAYKAMGNHVPATFARPLAKTPR